MPVRERTHAVTSSGQFDLFNAHSTASRIRERQKSLMLRAWIIGGLFFMALPGTLLGFSNLVAISAHHGLGALPPAWMEGHGHAQMFGWIGSFILGGPQIPEWFDGLMREIVGS